MKKKPTRRQAAHRNDPQFHYSFSGGGSVSLLEVWKKVAPYVICIGVFILGHAGFGPNVPGGESQRGQDRRPVIAERTKAPPAVQSRRGFPLPGESDESPRLT